MEPRTPDLAPLPGTDLPPRALFVGRSGALLRRPGPGLCHRFSEALLAPGALPLLFRAGQQGWRVYVVGNEPAVAAGRFPLAAWERFEQDLLACLRAQGVRVARHYACLTHPRGRGKLRRDSVFRFPGTGALYHAAQEDGLDLARSFVVSADPDELAAGWRAGCRVMAIARARAKAGDLAAEVDLYAPDLSSALRVLLDAGRRACA